MGQYHTIQLALNRAFTLEKPCWDSVYLDRVAVACDVRQRADLAAVVMHQGLAHVCLITQHMTIVRQRIEINIPRKRRASSKSHDKAIVTFYNAIVDAIERHVNFEVVKAVLVGSPAFIKDEFFAHLKNVVLKRDLKTLQENLSKFVLVHAPSGHKHALKEVLADPAVAARVADTKAFDEVQTLNRFFTMLNEEPDRAQYGFGHVSKCNEQHAIDTLLVSDDLFRASKVATRRQYVALVDAVKDNGGNVVVLSSMHVTGQQLNQMTGVAAILRFPLPHLDSDSEEDSDSDSDNDDDDEVKKSE
eukprot:TRINITY_DN65915_c3_g1_i2.p1 TRINITY_DN65915_c3_g1~~TRINITY_DN65915_c3_g1_i2.p1  ORF type:complete len:303 (+),score=130.13 TRINITY_DN65915_c3_g1_i2:196-1104(+)